MAITVADQRFLDCAKQAGASVAGLASASALHESVAQRHGAALDWLRDDHSLLIIGLAHPADEPHLDWWGGPGGTPGNRTLIEIAQRVCHQLTTELQVRARSLPYHVGRGGIFLKDAAAVAGVGTIGANNLLVTPGLGPRVRLRAIALDADVASASAERFEPCQDCDRPCQRACPQGAFASGSYDARRCSIQMRHDESLPQPRRSSAVVDSSYRIAYCRACELECPVGRRPHLLKSASAS